jgi:hypothetical protein
MVESFVHVADPLVGSVLKFSVTGVPRVVRLTELEKNIGSIAGAVVVRGAGALCAVLLAKILVILAGK